MNEEKEEILSPDKQLKNIKLGAYFDLLEELRKYRRLKVYRKANYPIINWINALVSFYDVMFSEANESKYQKKYRILFDKIKELNHTVNISYEPLLKCTIDMMKFANDTGITKLSKHQEGETPGGAEYA